MKVEADSKVFDVSQIDRIWIGDNGHVIIHWNDKNGKLMHTKCYEPYMTIPAILPK